MCPLRQRRLLAVDLQHALALEHVDHLVVGVEVVGRAAGRDQADELRHRRAADTRASRRARTRARRSPCRCSFCAQVEHGVRRRRRHGSCTSTETARARRRSAPRPCRGRRTARRPGRSVVRLAADASHDRCPRARTAPRRRRRRGASAGERRTTRWVKVLRPESAARRRCPSACDRVLTAVTLRGMSNGRDRQALVRRVRARRHGRRARRHASGDRVASGAGPARTAASTSGLDEVRRNIFDPLDEEWWDEFTRRPGRVPRRRRRGRRARALPRASAKGTGKQLDVPFVHIWTCEGDKAIRFRQFLDTAGWVETLRA